jgi:hypothetical protein
VKRPLFVKKTVRGVVGFCAAAALAVAAEAGPVAISPPALSQHVGDHLAFLVSSTSQPVLGWQWELNGNILGGQTGSALSLVNIQLTNAGTYTILATLTNGVSQASATLAVSSGFLPLASSNLVVARVGDGLQTLNTTTGNTLYLDQFQTNGVYASTVMIPDSGTSAIIAEGSGASVGLMGSVLTLSANGQYLNFAGYNHALPNSGITFTGASVPRAIGAVNGLGYFILCLTNTGLYNGGSGQIRCAVSTDGDVNNFWTGGLATQGSIKTVTSANSASGIPNSAAGTDPRVLNIFGGNLWVSSGNNNAGQTQGLYQFNGLPSGSPSTTATLGVSTGATSDPNDFAFSPDGLTVYIADDDNFTGSPGVGGVERWDSNGSAWVFNYSLGTGAGNWGARGLTVDFSQFSGGGSSASGAIVYATTAESSANRLIRIVDNIGASSPALAIATAGPNQLFRGVRFGPIAPAAATLETQMDDISVTAYGAVGDGVTDCTSAFDAALTAGKTHNGIYVPPGKYVISGSLTLGAEEMVGKIVGGFPADTAPMPTLLLRFTSGPGLIMNNYSSLHGIAIEYDQARPASSNAPAISVRGNGIAISSVQIQNPYDGITTFSTSQPGRARFSDIYIVSPAHVGVQISKAYDFVEYRDIEVVCPTVMSSGAAFVFQRVDEGNYTGLAASNCLTGFEFDHDPSTTPAGGDFTGSFAGCSVANCLNAVIINGPHKVKISGGDFSAINNGAVITAANEVTLAGGQWSAATGQAVLINSATNVIIDDCMFSRPVAMASPLVVANNLTTLTMNHCQFLPGSTGVQLGANVARAILLGNSLEDGGIANAMTSGKFIIGTDLIAATPQSQAPGLGASAGPAASQFTLSWPGWASDFVLYTTTNVAQSNSWAPITGYTAQSNSGQFNVTVPANTNAQQFFKLGPP